MTRKVVTITPDQSLEAAFELFEGKQISTLPVVDVEDSRRVVGMLKKSALIQAYSQNILKIGL
jgi:CIC family chloride channel protein